MRRATVLTVLYPECGKWIEELFLVCDAAEGAACRSIFGNF